ncbi:MAG: flagellar protein [Lachnospiraceae bacterium]|nr:flagellar protein [Lachnospiraceae bacterium]
MEVRNCRGCGRLFNYLQGQPLCPACMAELEEKFQHVKEFLRENPKAPLNVISEENDVSVKQIKQWVREERLAFTEESQITLECEACGGKVLSGRFCDKCRTSLQNDLAGAIKRPVGSVAAPKKNTNQKDKMRFLDK